MAVKKKTKAIVLAAVCVLIVAAIALSAVLIYRSTPQFALNEAGKYIDMGDYKSAIIALEEALIKFPDNADIRLALSEAYELNGDIENALRVLTEYIEMFDVPENRLNELEQRIAELGGSISTVSGAVTSDEAAQTDGEDQSGVFMSGNAENGSNSTVVYSSDNIPTELTGDPPASAEEVVKMMNDYLQYGKEPDRNALKFVTDIQIAGNRCLWVSIKDFDMDVYSSFSAEPHYDYNEETGEQIVSDTVFDILHFDLENDLPIEQHTEIVPWGTITDISFIPEYFPYLVGLEITFNKITDISPLKGMTGLRYLGMDYNEIDDISALSDMTEMHHLFLMNNSISDISAIYKMTKMQELVLYNNNIVDISSIASLNNLEYLELSENCIRDLTPLSGLPKLYNLFIDNNREDDYPENIDFHMPALEGLILKGFTFGKVTFSDMPAIKNINLFYSSASNVSVNDLNNLEEISFGTIYYGEEQRYSINELSISGLGALRDISCDNLIIQSISVYDVASLDEISISDSSVENINIDNAPLLKNIWLYGTNLPEGTITALKEKIPYAEIYS